MYIVNKKYFYSRSYHCHLPAYHHLQKLLHHPDEHYQIIEFADLKGGLYR